MNNFRVYFRYQFNQNYFTSSIFHDEHLFSFINSLIQSNKMNPSSENEQIPQMKMKFANIDSMVNKVHDIMLTKLSNVNFVFELNGDIVKLPANKAILSASSPVFNAMFNGDMKEIGDVKITDASPAEFEEFLQLFYKNPVVLTMNNLAGVFKLLDKYDVAEAIQNCADFLKENLTIDNVLLALYLAIKYQFNSLKFWCEALIQKNIKKVFDMFDLENTTVTMKMSSNQKFIPEDDLESLFVRVLAISKQAHVTQTNRIDFLRTINVYSVKMSKKDEWCNSFELNEDAITFYLSGNQGLIT